MQRKCELINLHGWLHKHIIVQLWNHGLLVQGCNLTPARVLVKTACNAFLCTKPSFFPRPPLSFCFLQHEICCAIAKNTSPHCFFKELGDEYSI